MSGLVIERDIGKIVGHIDRQEQRWTEEYGTQQAT
jgi:hypothetical protein